MASTTTPFRSMAVNLLGVAPSAVDTTLAFYRDKLGMDIDGSVAGFGPVVLHEQGSVALQLLPKEGENSMHATGYWKIGIGLPDVDAAAWKLRAAGVNVRSGIQFGEVGYLTHLVDAAGYTIELLQDTMKRNKWIFVKPTPANKPLACEHPKIGQISLNVSDIDASLRFYRDVLGMKLLCLYDVFPGAGGDGFALYFLAFTDEQPPDLDPNALVNREWTYSRPYTTLELAVGPQPTITVAGEDDIGWQGMVFGVSSVEAARAHLSKHGIATTMSNGCECAKDPDGYSIVLRDSWMQNDGEAAKDRDGNMQPQNA